ncbi:MAG: hypothetical protein JXR62_03400 [Bacilli bacterium]|nr:hypothetical protein [Bacilli bacterium]
MKKTKIKFVLSIIFLLNSLIIAVFFKNYTEILEKYLLPLFFIYFLIDSVVMLFPFYNKAVFSSKHFKKFFHPKKIIDIHKLKEKVNTENAKALAVFIVYFGFLTVLGVLYQKYDSFEKIHIYVLFFAANFADYFCILIWCPFRTLIFKNVCCNQCRISNWDRLMKFFILLFVPNIYTISVVMLGLIVFLVWEISHIIHPERFYLMSNDYLSCTNCNFPQCKKNKE